MTRKGDDTPSSSRIRENQRRSRMRRAELIQSLQERVQEYERQGVGATQEMQRAARKVAQDNMRLRALLALHGVSSEQVNSFLQSTGESVIPVVAGSSLQSPFTTPLHQGAEKERNLFAQPPEFSHRNGSQYLGHEQSRSDSQSVSDTAENHSAQNPASSRPFGSIVQPQNPSPEPPAECDPQSDYEDHARNFSRPVPGPSECPSSLECFCAPPLASEYRPSSSGLKISCEAAATVIAEMRGCGDRDSIRASLGCRGQESCTVKNSMVLQIMDEG